MTETKAGTRRGSQSQKRKKGGDKCETCNKCVLEKDYGIQCEICKSYHAKCVDISVEVYTYLERSKILHWFCDLCNRRVAQVMEEIIRLKGRQEIIEQEIAVVKNEIEEMKKDINKTDTKLDTAIETKLLDVVENKVEENVVENKVESKVDKSMDIERRRCNLVIHGIDERTRMMVVHLTMKV